MLYGSRILEGVIVMSDDTLEYLEWLPTKCRYCPYRDFNDDWCIIFEADCYLEARKADLESE